jgi:hypothetical protein
MNDGGPAFPGGIEYSTNEGAPDDCFPKFPGMSLRDHFAGLAMQALIPLWWDENDIFDTPAIADDAYKMADAMLAERAKEKP